MSNTLYLFLDESGDLGFGPKASRFFALTSVAMYRPFQGGAALDDLRYDLLEKGVALEQFHCANDNRHVRSQVFEVIAENLGNWQIDTCVIEKRKTHPSLHQHSSFYTAMFAAFLNSVSWPDMVRDAHEVIIITDALPVRGKRNAVQKALQGVMAHTMPNTIKYNLLHHQSSSHYGLQIADYCGWAVFRKFEYGDPEAHNKLRHAVNSETLIP
ncbi:MAG: DUF3800 domain-containing protein [Chloroflexi bacterium]|nr:DUF3800 domain-containing protein [Chloroflexota bacterium]